MRLATFLLLILAPAGAAQTLLVELPVEHPSMGPAGDLDGDGSGDFYLGGIVYSGADQTALLDTSAAYRSPAATTVLDDWNGDGTPDLVVSDTFYYRILSGVDGSEVGTGGVLGEWVVHLANAGDLDGDGRDDLLGNGGGWLCIGGGMVVDMSGSPPLSFYGDSYIEYAKADTVGDIDGDGRNEFAYIYIEGFYEFYIEVRDDQGLIGRLPVSPGVPCEEAIHFSALGDCDGDGRDDVLVASDGTDPHTRIVSGADLATVLLDLPYAESIASPGDADCDGVPDLLLGWPGLNSDAGRVELVSGADGSLLWSADGSPGDRLGHVETAGDVNGDGVGDWLVGGTGFTRVYLADPPAPSTYCAGKATSAGCTPFLDWSGLPTATGPDDFLVLTRDALAGKPGLFFFGTSGPIDVPFQGGTLCVAPPLTRTPVQFAAGAQDCEAGYAFFFGQAYAASQGIAPGATVNGQFWMRDPDQGDGTGAALTDGIELTWCP